MAKHVWYAVRCCCTPKKIFGFLNLPEGEEGDKVQVNDKDGISHTIELRIVRLPLTAPTPLDMIDVLRHASAHRMPEELAIYSDERGCDFWRTVPGFLEVKHA